MKFDEKKEMFKNKSPLRAWRMNRKKKFLFWTARWVCGDRPSHKSPGTECACSSLDDRNSARHSVVVAETITICHRPGPTVTGHVNDRLIVFSKCFPFAFSTINTNNWRIHVDRGSRFMESTFRSFRSNFSFSVFLYVVISSRHFAFCGVREQKKLKLINLQAPRTVLWNSIQR